MHRYRHWRERKKGGKKEGLGRKTEYEKREVKPLMG